VASATQAEPLTMRVFIPGASGYIGSAVADRLLAAGHEVTGLARTDSSAARLTAAGVRPVRGDFADPSSLSAPARAADAVINLATTYDAAVDPPAIDALLDALAGSGKPFIYTGGNWLYGDTGGKVLDESSPPRPLPHITWRPGVEQRVLGAASRGVRGIVICPTMVYGRAGGVLADLTRSAREEGAARFVGTGENRWPLVHVDDLADLYLLALERAPAGTLLFATAGPAIRVRDLAAAASRASGAGGRTTAVPLAEARKTMGAEADGLALDQQFSSRRARELLGWTPRRPDALHDLEHGSYVTAARLGA
jgi:nucleoside-diphosphate-sugar epimerase